MYRNLLLLLRATDVSTGLHYTTRHSLYGLRPSVGCVSVCLPISSGLLSNEVQSLLQSQDRLRQAQLTGFQEHQARQSCTFGYTSISTLLGCGRCSALSFCSDGWRGGREYERIYAPREESPFCVWPLVTSLHGLIILT